MKKRLNKVLTVIHSLASDTALLKSASVGLDHKDESNQPRRMELANKVLTYFMSNVAHLHSYRSFKPQ